MRRVLILTGLSLLSLVSCQKLFVSDRAGKPVTFSASSDITLTKTAYSGEVIDGRERINWVDGDPVKIFMYTHDGYRNNAEMTTRDYQVVNISTDGVKSVGKVASSAGNLIWEEGKTHDFYSVYPGNYIGSNNISGYDRKISLTLPSAQQGDVAANMRYAYMAAVHEGYSTEGRGSVVLDYYPMVTTIYVTLHNATSEPVTVKSVRLKSTDSNISLVGTYKISTSGGETPFAPLTYDYIATSPEVSVVLNNTTLQPGGNATCVFFLMPVRTYNPSAMKLTVVTGGGMADISLANSTNIQFEPCKKYNLSFNVEERQIEYSDLTPVMNNLCTLSNSVFCTQFEYLPSAQPPGLYYKEPQWPRVPVSDADIAQALQEITEISNENNHNLDWLMHDLTPADFTIFPNLQSINLSNLGNNNSFSVANLTNLLELTYGGNAASLSVANCSFDPNEASPLVIKSSSYLKNISLTNITGLQEIILQGGDNGGGNVGQVFIQDCPDVKTIKILQVGGDVPLEKAVFDNLGVETIYIERANFTTDIEISNCPNLKRFIVCKQANWMLENVTITNCAQLGDSATDSSEYGLTGFNIERVADNFVAYKYNCPNLGPTFSTHNKYGPTTITFR